MKRVARLNELMADMEAGRLSRNKHFDAYQKPEVINARARKLRMKRLKEMLDLAESERWRFSLIQTQDTHEGDWELTCTSEVINGTWTARLFDFELEMLYNHPRGRDLLVAQQ